MTGKEGKSTTLEPLPSGHYLMAITDIDLDQCGPDSKNPGKDMFKVELTVQDGDYENRKAWTNVMLFDGALYSIAQMIKAQGVDIKEVGDSAEFQVPGFAVNEIPGPEYWMGKQFVCRVKLVGKRKDPKTGKEYDERAEIKGFMSPKNWDPNKAPKKATAEAGTATRNTSILP
jgi:hypothetical protein